MKVATVCSTLTLATLAVVANAGQSIVKGRINIDAIKNMLPIVKEELLPSAVSFINNDLIQNVFPSKPLEFDILEPISESFSLVQGSLSTAIKGVSLTQTSTDVSFVASRGNHSNSALLNARTEHLSINLGEVATVLDAVIPSFLGIPETRLNCGVAIAASASIPQLGLSLDTSVVPGDSTGSFGIEQIDISLPVLTIDVPTLTGDCEVATDIVTELSTLVVEGLSALITEVAGDINEALSNAATDFAKQFRTSNIPLTFPITGLEIVSGRMLDITPSVVSYGADSSPANYLQSDGALAVTARLTEPAHRAGSSLVIETGELSEFPDPSVDQLVNVHISSDGINEELIEPGFYLAWSTVATDEAAMKSSLCESTPLDPCKYPPVQLDIEGVAGFFVTLATMLFTGPMKDWRLEAVAYPPRVEFGEEQVVSGIVSGSVVLRAKSLFGNEKEVAAVDVSAAIDALIPSYDSATGQFSRIGFHDAGINVDDIILGTLFSPLIEFLVQRPLVGLVNSVFGNVIPTLNDFLSNAVQSIPFKIPDIPVDFLGFDVVTEFEGAFAEGVPATGGTGSYLKLGSNFVVRSKRNDSVRSTTLNERKSPSVSSRTAQDSTAFQMAMLPDATVGATFSSSFTDLDGASKSFFLRLVEPGHVEQFMEGLWVPMSPRF